MHEEIKRLEESAKRQKHWKRWGPYLAERQWATVREDYSYNGASWSYLTHDQARSRAYRWGEDGILGITDRQCRLSFALSFWNEKDPFLKERLFGLVPEEANHGEDVKECYYYLDSTPTHSYMKGLYKYPQEKFPYALLIAENKKRGLTEPEFELTDTDIFEYNRYFDIFAEYCKNFPNDILIRIEIVNRSSKPSRLHFLPTLWFRNTWSWGKDHEGFTDKLNMRLEKNGQVLASHETLGDFYFAYETLDNPTPLFTENETNFKKLYNVENKIPYTKDAFNEYVVNKNKDAVNFGNFGSKFSPYRVLNFAPNETKILKFRLFSKEEAPKNAFNADFEAIFEKRKQEADDFYKEKIPSEASPEEKNILRQTYASLLWSKQFYHYVVKEWLEGDENQPIPPPDRMKGRNKDWVHIYCKDVISMPDKWEYPWFAAWDLAFHMIPFAKIDPDFAKEQMILFLREWYMHPNGQQPAYEFEFSDANPPVHAWAAWRIYKMTGKKGARDRAFLESAFQKLLLNFTWWVNRKDRHGNNLFSGGFLGLDNIGIFDRSKISKMGGYLEQADGTAWMAFYCLTMLTIALELAVEDPVYEDMASKFFEHFIYIADAINEFRGSGLWNEQDGFYYDVLHQDDTSTQIKIRSLVGLIPLIAVEILEESHIQKLKGFSSRMHWFLKNRKDLEDVITYCEVKVEKAHRILAIPSKERLVQMLSYLLDEKEFLSPFGVRSLSKYYQKHPYVMTIFGKLHKVEYVPGEGNSTLFGGNSNWRGPIWFPLNFLIIEALERYHHYYGDSLKVECPTNSGHFMNLKEVAEEISSRLSNIFLPNKEGKRPCFDGVSIYQDPNWKELLLFNEYFNGDTGKGLGANHQTGWTSLIANLLENRILEKSKLVAAPLHDK